MNVLGLFKLGRTDEATPLRVDKLSDEERRATPLLAGKKS